MTEETLLSFPCQFPIKIIGRNTEDFESQVLAIISKHVPDLGEDAISNRASGKGNYLSITVTINATSKEQLDKIYLELSACDTVMMTL